jgi:hypothetical protein
MMKYLSKLRSIIGVHVGCSDNEVDKLEKSRQGMVSPLDDVEKGAQQHGTFE